MYPMPLLVKPTMFICCVPPPRDCADDEWATFETAMVAWAVEQGSVQNAEAGWRPAGRGDAVVYLRPRDI